MTNSVSRAARIFGSDSPSCFVARSSGGSTVDSNHMFFNVLIFCCCCCFGVLVIRRQRSSNFLEPNQLYQSDNTPQLSAAAEPKKKMPAYELLLQIRKLQRPDLTVALKRAANFILDNNGILRKIENLGTQPLHQRVGNPVPNAKPYTEASFFLYHLDTSPDVMRKIHEDCRRDNDFVRVWWVKKASELPEGYQCTLEEEMKPPALRQSVQKLIEEGRRKEPAYDMGDKANVRQIA